MKYIGSMLIEVKRGYIYKIDTLLNLIYPVIRFMVQYSFWNYIYNSSSNSELLFNMSKEEMILYFLYSYLLTVIIKSDASEIGKQIKTGAIDRDLLKPISYMKLTLFKNIGNRVVPVICSLPLFLIARSLIIANIEISGFVLFKICIVLLAILIGFLINFMIDYLIGIAALSYGEIWAIGAAINQIKRFVAGEFLPISLFPIILYNVISYSPFQFIIYFPVSIIQTDEINSSIVFVFLIGVFWLITLYFLCRFLWNYMIKKYSSFGG